MLGKKILAIASGKGGVGKSTTAVNIALLSARSGIRTGIIDMDPLSNLSVILDIGRHLGASPQNLSRNYQGQRTEYKQPKHQHNTSNAGQNLDLAFYTQHAFACLDILFSGTKTEDIVLPLYELVFHRFAEELNKQYDLLILDLPAGISQTDNLRILPELKNLLIVTNAEPTSHVASGGYIKAALEVNSSLLLYIWNNKFEAGRNIEFNPQDLIGNYNRYAPRELRLPNSVSRRMVHVAFVPEDSSLNLLNTQVDFRIQILNKIRESLELMFETIIPIHTKTSAEQGSMGNSRQLSYEELTVLRYYLLQESLEPHRARERFIDFLQLYGKDTGTTTAHVDEYIRNFEKNPLRKVLAECQHKITRIFFLNQSGNFSQHDVYDKEGMFSQFSRSYIRCIALFNRFIERWGEKDLMLRFGNVNISMLKKASALSFFYFSMLGLLENRSVRNLIHNFIPKKNNTRNRHLQIRLLVEDSTIYRKNYFRLIKSIFPVMEKHLYKLSQDTKNVLFYNEKGVIMRNVYLKLLSELVHEMLNAGLGVHIGLKFNKASIEIQKGWSQIRDRMEVQNGRK